jgi:acyl-CoA thioester hydrolase
LLLVSHQIPAPLRLHETRVPPAWVDYNGHMSESFYLLAVGDNSDAFFRYIGIDDDYRAAGNSLYTVETHLRHLGEAALGDQILLTLRLLDCDHKRVHLFHSLYRGEDLLATAEQMLVHVDMRAARSAPLPYALQEKLAAIKAAHASLGVPEGAGASIGIGRADVVRAD